MQFVWLPVLSDVPSLRRKAATDNMLQIIEARPQIGLCMLMSLSVHLHALHLSAQRGQT